MRASKRSQNSRYAQYAQRLIEPKTNRSLLTLRDSGDDEVSCEGFTSRTLGGVLNCVRERNLFMFNNIFRNVRRFDTEEIQFDRVYSNDQVIPFVHPCNQAPIMDTVNHWDSTIFKPAYVKAKGIVNCCEPMKFMPGEYCWGQLTERQRFEAKVAEVMQMLNKAVDLREELMMWKALINGKYTVEGENYPASVVDFKRDKELTGVCFDWPKESCDILSDLQTLYDEIMCRSGAMVTHIIAGPKVCNAIKNNKAIQDLICKCEGRSLAEMSFDLTPRPQTFGVRPEISIGGVDIWCSTAFWQCKNGPKYEKRLYLEPDEMIFMSLGNNDCNLQPTRLYGAIRHCKSLMPQDRFVTMWEENDPSAFIQMIQSSPLPVLLNANASASAKVTC